MVKADMRKGMLLKGKIGAEERIYRVLDLKEKVLVLDCVKKTMPVWKTYEELSDCVEKEEESMAEAIDIIDAMEGESRKTAYQRYNKYPCDLLSFTFPCQNISIDNRKAKGFEEGEDSSSSIIWSLRDVLSQMKQKPKMIFMENVAAILNKKHKHTLNRLIAFLQGEGYHVDYKKLDAADYGVPQHRERVYILCTLGFDPCFTYPAPIPLEAKLCDVLEKNPSPQFNLTPKAKAGFISRGMRDDKPYPIRVHNPSKCDKAFTISTRSGSRNYDNFIFEKDVTDDRFIKVSKKGLAKAGVDLKAIEDMNIRKLTPDECMVLMGLKKEEREKLKDFTPNEIYKLTGNSIVVPVLIGVFNEYFKALKDNGKLDDMDMAS